MYVLVNAFSIKILEETKLNKHKAREEVCPSSIIYEGAYLSWKYSFTQLAKDIYPENNALQVVLEQSIGNSIICLWQSQTHLVDRHLTKSLILMCFKYCRTRNSRVSQV